MPSRAAQVAGVPLIRVDGTWQRHVSARSSELALDGRRGYGRWGTRDGFPVLYLGRPTDSVVIEAYRHLVDPVVDPLPASAFAQRILVTADVSVSDILDLRTAIGRMRAGLTIGDLRSPTNDHESYARCQEVSQVAHQLGRLGVIAPAATFIGDTLALFTDLIPAEHRPQRSSDDQLWTQLPADPRTRTTPSLRLVSDSD